MDLYRNTLSSTHERVAAGRWCLGGLSGLPVGVGTGYCGQLVGLEVGGARARFQVVKTGHSSIAA